MVQKEISGKKTKEQQPDEGPGLVVISERGHMDNWYGNELRKKCRTRQGV